MEIYTYIRFPLWSFVSLLTRVRIHVVFSIEVYSGLMELDQDTLGSSNLATILFFRTSFFPNFKSQDFCSWRNFSSWAGALRDNGVNRGSDNEILAIFLVFSALLNCSSTFSRIALQLGVQSVWRIVFCEPISPWKKEIVSSYWYFCPRQFPVLPEIHVG